MFYFLIILGQQFRCRPSNSGQQIGNIQTHALNENNYIS